MASEANIQVTGEHQDSAHENRSEVTIMIDNKHYEVHRGHQTVAYLKELGGISQNYELDEVRDGQLIPLDDDGSITLKGGEVFKSNLKVGRSS